MMTELKDNGTTAEPERVQAPAPEAYEEDDGQLETLSVPPAVKEYLEVAGAVAVDEDVSQGLQALKMAVESRDRLEADDWDQVIDGLTRYSYQVVRSWLAIISVSAGEQLEWESFRLLGDDVDRLAETVVSRAENGFLTELNRVRWWLDSPEPDMKALHLAECAIQLPAAYRDWRLRHRAGSNEDSLEDLALEHVDSADSAWPIRRLYQSLTGERDRVVHLLHTLRYNQTESTEIVDATLAAFDLLARKGGSR